MTKAEDMHTEAARCFAQSLLCVYIGHMVTGNNNFAISSDGVAILVSVSVSGLTIVV